MMETWALAVAFVFTLGRCCGCAGRTLARLQHHVYDVQFENVAPLFFFFFFDASGINKASATRSHICNFSSTKAALACFEPTLLLFTCCLMLAFVWAEMHSSLHFKPRTGRVKDAHNWKSWHYQWCIKSTNCCRHMAAAFAHSPADSIVSAVQKEQQDWREARLDENAADTRKPSADRWSRENRAGADRYLPPARAPRTHKHTPASLLTAGCWVDLSTLLFLFGDGSSRETWWKQIVEPRCCSSFPELGQAAILPSNKGKWKFAQYPVHSTQTTNESSYLLINRSLHTP